MNNNAKWRRIGDTKETYMTSISKQTSLFLGKPKSSTITLIEGSERSRDQM